MNSSNPLNDRLAHVAHYLVVHKEAHGLSKSFCLQNDLNLVRSIGTARNYKQHIKQYLRWRVEVALPLDGPHLVQHLQEYLFEQEEYLQQKQLDVCRQSLQTVFNVALEKATSHRVTFLKARACSSDEFELIVACQSERNRISARLCDATGARAHELFTMVPSSSYELDRSTNRPWRSDLFCHSTPSHIYTVAGKGGLRRHIAVPIDLAQALESLRLNTPMKVLDRGIIYFANYDIGGGKTLSQSFSDASMRAIGSSKGLHGLRHNYAQRRMVQLKSAGVSSGEALSIVSQELGHFRPDITLTYLR